MHYYCEECGGVSQEPGVCKTENCDMQGEDLVACDCDQPDSHAKPEAEEHERDNN